MPIPVQPKADAWSFSRWQDYTKCPAMFMYKHIQKIKEPGNAAMSRGTDMHTGAEEYLVGKRRTLLTELKSFAAEFKALKAAKPHAELQWAFDIDWEPCGWFDRTAHLRVKIDAFVPPNKDGLVQIIDFKSGKVYAETGQLQLELYGLAGMLMYPTAKVIQAALWYVDQGQETKYEFPAKDIGKLKKLWDKRVRPMFADRRFAPTPGNSCRWCHFRKSNNGPCKFG